MADRKLVVFTLFLLVFGAVTPSAFAYGVDVHAFLTDETIDF